MMSLRVPRGVSLVLAALLVSVTLGCARAVLAQSPSPSPSVPPASRVPIDTPPPLAVAPPQIVAEAGLLPTSAFSVLERIDEGLQRTLFSFWIPGLRARVALGQAAERIAELQALERDGLLSPDRARGLVEAHDRLIALASGIAARKFAAGSNPLALLLELTRTRLASADILAGLADELESDAELDGEIDSDAGRVAAIVSEVAERLVHVEDDLVAAGAAEETLPADALRVLAEQKIAKAERDLQRALFTAEEQRAHGKVLIADAELQAAAESALVTARQLFAAGNVAEALALAKDAHRIAGRLAAHDVAVEQDVLASAGGAQRIQQVLDALVDDGVLGSADAAAARRRVLEARTRLTPPAKPKTPEDDVD